MLDSARSQEVWRSVVEHRLTPQADRPQILEGHLEPGAVRRGAHRTDEEWLGIRQAAQAQQFVVLAIDGGADLDIRPGAADPQPEGAGVVRKGHDGPVRMVPRDHGARVLAAVDELDAAFEPDPCVEADHQSRLVVLVTIGAGYFDAGDEVSIPRPEPEVPGVTDKAIVGRPPEIGCGAASQPGSRP